MQDHWGVLAHKDNEDVGRLVCESGEGRTQAGEPDNEVCAALNRSPGTLCEQSQRMPAGGGGSKLTPLGT